MRRTRRDLPERRAAPLTAAAIKAAAGAAEHLLLAQVADLAATLTDLRGQGLRAIGADQSASLAYSQVDLRGPLALVVGSEGFGISGQLRRRLDQTVRIPMRGKVASLNAAVAGSVLLFAAAGGNGAAPESPTRTWWSRRPNSDADNASDAAPLSSPTTSRPSQPKASRRDKRRPGASG